MRFAIIFALLISVSSAFAVDNCMSCHGPDHYWSYSDRCTRNDSYFSYYNNYYGNSYYGGFCYPHRYYRRSYPVWENRVIRPSIVIPFSHVEVRQGFHGEHHHHRR